MFSGYTRDTFWFFRRQTDFVDIYRRVYNTWEVINDKIQY